jgi:hypothetical protein
MYLCRLINMDYYKASAQRLQDVSGFIPTKNAGKSGRAFFFCFGRIFHFPENGEITGFSGIRL